MTRKREFLLKDPNDPTRVIAYGWEEARGYYAALFVAGTRVASRELTNATRRQARDDIIEWVIELGFFSIADLDEVTSVLDTLRVDQLPGRLRTIVDVVRSFGQ